MTEAELALDLHDTISSEEGSLVASRIAASTIRLSSEEAADLADNPPPIPPRQQSVASPSPQSQVQSKTGTKGSTDSHRTAHPRPITAVLSKHSSTSSAHSLPISAVLSKHSSTSSHHSLPISAVLSKHSNTSSQHSLPISAVLSKHSSTSSPFRSQHSSVISPAPENLYIPFRQLDAEHRNFYANHPGLTTLPEEHPSVDGRSAAPSERHPPSFYSRLSPSQGTSVLAPDHSPVHSTVAPSVNSLDPVDMMQYPMVQDVVHIPIFRTRKVVRVKHQGKGLCGWANELCNGCFDEDEFCGCMNLGGCLDRELHIKIDPNKKKKSYGCC